MTINTMDDITLSKMIKVMSIYCTSVRCVRALTLESVWRAVKPEACSAGRCIRASNNLLF